MKNFLNKINPWQTLLLSILLLAFSLTLSARAQSEKTPGVVAPGEPMTLTLPAADTTAVYLVQLAGEPVASYRGGLPGLAATHPATAGVDGINANDTAVVAYQQFLLGQHDDLVAAAGEVLDRSLAVRAHYTVAWNGLALLLTPAEAAEMTGLPDVVAVRPEQWQTPTTDASPAFVGATSIWDGTAVPGGTGYQGEGVIVGVIDTGINIDHPAFAATGGDGYTHSYSGSYKGLCAGAPALCNDKLIGLWDFVSAYGENDGAEDSQGHGSHTASTAAGNALAASITTSNGFTYNAPVAGIAPHAHIIAYDACVVTCPESALLTAVEQAIVDGVDVINYSISGGQEPYDDPIAQAFLRANDAGIFVAASAGNTGPDAATINHLAPWVTTVAATTHDRRLTNRLTQLTSSAGSLADINGQSVTGDYGPAPIVHAGDYGDALCLQPFPPNTFQGQIVVCDRGQIARVDKGFNVLSGGGGGMVLANTDAAQTVNSDVHYLPAVHISAADAAVLKTWLAIGSNHQGAIAGTIVGSNISAADIIAGFSARGPNTAVDLIKPDLAAPGVDILAAERTVNGVPGPEFGFRSGTSMASPQVAGAAALLRGLQPAWTPDEIRSALTTTGVTASVVKEDGQTPADVFDYGGGRLDLTRAAQTGLVFSETKTNYENANPAGGGDPRTLNVPALADSSCFQQCSWTRTVRSTLAEEVTWTATAVASNGLQLSITPAQFSITTGASQALTITADVTGFDGAQGWGFAAVELTSPGQQTLRLPVAVQKAYATDPAQLHKSGPDWAQPGQVITYEITLDNLDNITHTFALVDTLPPGVAYVPGSATGGLTYDAVDHRLVWSGEMGPGTQGYAISEVAPLNYVNLGDVDNSLNSLCSVFSQMSQCDDGAVSFDLAGDWAPASYSFSFFGEPVTAVQVSANGIIFGDGGCGGSLAACTALPQPLPHANEVNQTIAGLWRDIDMSGGVGEWYAALVNGLLPSGDKVFYANWHNAGQFGDPTTTSRHAIAMVLDGQSEPAGRLYYIYDNINGRDALSELHGFAIGVENAAGTVGATQAFSPCRQGPCVSAPAQGMLPANGVTLRLDPAVVGGASARTFTYQVVVEAPAHTLLVNEVQVTSDGPTAEITAVADTWVAYRLFLPMVGR